VFVSLDGYIVGRNEDISWVMDNFNRSRSSSCGPKATRTGSSYRITNPNENESEENQK
jgi:hypothetical protein